jgi:hypothetical protein
MATRKNKNDRRGAPEADEQPAVRVVIAGYEMSDADIDNLLETSIRIVERAMVNPRFLKLIALGLKFAG